MPTGCSDIRDPSYICKLVAPWKDGIPALQEAIRLKQIGITSAPYIAKHPPEKQAALVPLCIGKPRKAIINICGGVKRQKREKFHKVKMPCGVTIWIPADKPVDALDAAVTKGGEVVKQLLKEPRLVHALPELLAAS